MTITLTTRDGARLRCRGPHPGAGYVVPSAGEHSCGACGAPIAARMLWYETQHDRYVGDAVCVNVLVDGDGEAACGARLGTMTVELSTIFGLEEDNRIHGGARVY